MCERLTLNEGYWDVCHKGVRRLAAWRDRVRHMNEQCNSHNSSATQPSALHSAPIPARYITPYYIQIPQSTNEPKLSYLDSITLSYFSILISYQNRNQSWKDWAGIFIYLFYFKDSIVKDKMLACFSSVLLVPQKPQIPSETHHLNMSNKNLINTIYFRLL